MRIPVLAAALLGCRHPGSDTHPGTAPRIDCEAALSLVTRTVVNVTWTAPEGSRSWVEFGIDGSDTTHTDTVSDSAVILPLVGFPGGSTLTWRGVSELDGVQSTCSGETVTGTVPVEFPVFTVDVDTRAGQEDLPFILGAYYNLFAPMPYFVVLNRGGEIVWYAVGEATTLSPDIQFSLDGNGILYNVFPLVEGLEASTIHRIALDGTPLQVIPTFNAHHMFEQLPDGTLAFQQLDGREYTDPETGLTQTWYGDAIAEVPLDGEATTVFSVWDWLVPGENAHTADPSIYGGVDWTHGNALKYHEPANTWFLSLAHLQDVVTIDRTTRSPVATIGLDGTQAVPPFDLQHDPTQLENGNVLMFSTDPDTLHSGAIEYRDDGDQLTEVWRRGFDAHTDYLGQATRLANGNTFVTYGSQGVMEEVDPEGVVVWHGSTGEGGSATGQFRPFASFYTGR